MSVLLLGTGSGVGKTVVAALLLQRWGNAIDLAYWQPVATGAAGERDADTVARLCTARVDVIPETFLFDAAAPPHVAARGAGVEIDPAAILGDLARHRRSGRGLVVEGVGGFLEPLTDWGYLQSDLVARIRLPVLLVARAGAGAVNHALLTLEAMRARQLPIAGVVLVGARDAETRAAIERFGKTTVLLEIEPLATVSAETIARAAPRLDPRGDLAPLLAPLP